MCIGLQIFQSHSPTCKLYRGYWGGNLILRPLRKFGGDGELGGGAQFEWNGHPRVFDTPIPKTLVIWASPPHITLAIWVRVRVTGYAHITRDLGMRMPRTWPWAECPYHCDSGCSSNFLRKKPWGEVTGVGDRDEFRRTCSQATEPHVYMRQFLRTGPSF